MLAYITSIGDIYYGIALSVCQRILKNLIFLNCIYTLNCDVFILLLQQYSMQNIDRLQICVISLYKYRLYKSINYLIKLNIIKCINYYCDLLVTVLKGEKKI